MTDGRQVDRRGVVDGHGVVDGRDEVGAVGEAGAASSGSGPDAPDAPGAASSDSGTGTPDAPDAPRAGSADPGDSPVSPAAARVVGGRYRLTERLGSGAMGTVWRAEDVLLGRAVAVKEVVFPPGTLPGEADVLRERTRREARAAARLDHPSAVTVFDVVEEDGRPWLVLELVVARSLADVVRDDGPLSPVRAAQVGLAVLGALEAAHAQGILHRDVKPGNVLLTAPHDPGGRVVLTDFGIATSAGDSALTSSGLLLGSPAYIAPERARGQSPGPASDLWSLGATLYTAVEGRPAYDEGGDALRTVTAVVTGRHAPYVLAGPLAPALEGLLDKDPAARLDAAAARAALRQVAIGRDDTGSARLLAAPAPDATKALHLADLHLADLHPADLHPADLHPADLHPADLHPADLHLADLHLADLHRTDLHLTVQPDDDLEGQPEGSPAHARHAEDSTVHTRYPDPQHPAAPVPRPTHRRAATGEQTDGRHATVPVPVPVPGLPRAATARQPGDPVARLLSNDARSADALHRPPRRPSRDDAPPPARPDRPARAPGRRARVALVTAGLVAVAGAAGVVLTRDPSGSSSAAAPRSTTSAAPSASPAVPAGWTTWTAPEGWTVAVPADWVRSTYRDQVQFRDEAHRRTLRIDTDSDDGTGALQAWQQTSPQFAAALADYRQVRLEPVAFRGLDAADLEFTYTSQSTALHVLDRGFVAGGTRHALYWQTGAADFDASRPVFEQVAAAFQAPPATG